MQRVIVLFFLLCILVIRYQLAKPDYGQGDTIRITSIVRSQTISYEKSQYIKLAGLTLYLPLYPAVGYGDKIIVEGRVEEDSLKNPVLIDIVENKNVLFDFRSKLLEIYQRSLPVNESALVSGVTIGSKSQITNDFWEKLKKTGTAHVVVASGMNVTLVAGFLMSTGQLFAKRRLAIFFVIAGIWVYSILCGFDAPIVRAAVMGTIAFWAQESGRLNQTFRTLLISAYIMLLVNPDWTADVGFLLSFSATMSLIIFSTKISNFLSKVKLVRSLPAFILESLSTTLSAQIGVLPVLFVTFGGYSPFSLLVNTLTLWVIPLVTVIGFIGGIAGLVYFPFGKIILLCAYPLARYFTFIVDVFS